MKRVMVATDLSARCDRAIDRGVQLALHWGSEPMIAHVLSDRAREQDQTAVAAALRETLPDPSRPAELLLGSGAVPEALHHLVASAGADLLVTGVARHNHLGDYFIGTAVDQIIRSAEVPVLVIKRRPHRRYRRILAPTDLSSCAREAVLAAIELFPDAAIDVVHAYHVAFEAWLDSPAMRAQAAEDAEARLQAFLSHRDFNSHRDRIDARIGYGETEQVISDALRDSGADLVVLGTHERGGLGRAARGSIAEAILSWVDTDALIVRSR